MKEEVYHGPMSMEKALSAAEGSEGVRIAVSVPNGAYVAVEMEGDETTFLMVRRVERQSGHGGSVEGTGEWINPTEIPPTISWRPG